MLHLNLEDGKMSKSKGEFLTVQLLRDRGYDPMAYRFFCLGSHYRKALLFSWEGLDNAAAAYDKLTSRIAALLSDKAAVPDAVDAQDEENAAKLRSGFAEAMDNDLNTSLALTALYDVLKADISAASKLRLIADYDSVLSLDLIAAAQKKNSAPGDDVSDKDKEILACIEARAEAKRSKNYAEADRIRAELLEKGIVLTDTKDGTTFKRV